MHERLVRYYAYFGFKRVVEVTGKMSDLGHMLVGGSWCCGCCLLRPALVHACHVHTGRWVRLTFALHCMMDLARMLTAAVARTRLCTMLINYRIWALVPRCWLPA